jgi:SacI homology domain
MQSLQQNVVSMGDTKEIPYDNLFVWNAFLTEPIRSRCNNSLWTVALVHGYYKQVELKFRIAYFYQFKLLLLDVSLCKSSMQFVLMQNIFFKMSG